MAIDRSKYRKASSEEQQEVNNQMAEREGSGRSEFLKIEEGVNVIRIFPASSKAKKTLFMYPSVTTYLPILVDEKDDKGNKTGKRVEKKRPVFNAKVHGGLDRDIVEEYIDAAKEKFLSQYEDKKDAYKQLEVCTNFKTGIRYSTAWVCFARKKKGSKFEYGRLSLSNGIKKQLDNLSLRQGESGEAIVVDLCSDPDTGKAIQIIYDSKSEDPKAKYKVNLLFEEDAPLSDEELEWLEDQPETLEDLYTNCYKKSDFEIQIEGLKRFDKVNKIGVFETPSFQSVIESIAKEVEKLGSSKKDDKKKSKDEKKSSKKDKDENDSEEIEIPEVLNDLDKSSLKELINKLELETEYKVTIPPTKLKKAILVELIEKYDLDVDDLESQISDLIEQAFSDENEDNSSENKSENNSSEDNNSNEEENNSEEENQSENESENESEQEEEKPKKSGLLEKYKNKKGKK